MRSKLRFNDRGTPIIKRQLANDVKKMCEMVGPEETKRLYDIDDDLLAKIILKKFPAKSRGLSMKEVREAKKTINKFDKLAKSLGVGKKPTSSRRGPATSKSDITIINVK